MKQIVIEIDDEVYEGVTGDTTFRDYERKALNAIRNGTVLPKNPTNGEVIESIFSPTEYNKYVKKIACATTVMQDWWNAPYEAKEQSE